MSTPRLPLVCLASLLPACGFSESDAVRVFDLLYRSSIGVSDAIQVQANEAVDGAELSTAPDEITVGLEVPGGDGWTGVVAADGAAQVALQPAGYTANYDLMLDYLDVASDSITLNGPLDLVLGVQTEVEDQELSAWQSSYDAQGSLQATGEVWETVDVEVVLDLSYDVASGAWTIALSGELEGYDAAELGRQLSISTD